MNMFVFHFPPERKHHLFQTENSLTHFEKICLLKGNTTNFMQKDILTCMHKYLNSNLRPVVRIWQYPCLFLFPLLGAKSKLKTLVFKLFLMLDRQSEPLNRKGSRDTQNWINNISMLKCLKSMRLLLYILLSCLHVLSQMFKPKEISDLMQLYVSFGCLSL